jgi:hypothetical protein
MLLMLLEPTATTTTSTAGINVLNTASSPVARLLNSPNRSRRSGVSPQGVEEAPSAWIALLVPWSSISIGRRSTAIIAFKTNLERDKRMAYFLELNRCRHKF